MSLYIHYEQKVHFSSRFYSSFAICDGAHVHNIAAASQSSEGWFTM